MPAHTHTERCGDANCASFVPLLHQRPDREPEAVREGEVVLEDEPGVDAGVGAGPLVGGEPGNDPDGQGDQDVGEQYVEPDLQSQRVHKRKQLRKGEKMYTSVWQK